MSDNHADRRDTFEALFRERRDPWDFESSAYESAKRRETLCALDGRHFTHMFEVGCATGVLTADLSRHCDRLTAIDVSTTALERAQARLASTAHVEWLRGAVPDDWPDARFDAIILSEVLYFLSAEEIAHVSAKAHRSLEPDGMCLLVNWTGESDCAVEGPAAVRIFAGAGDWVPTLQRSYELYRVDRFAKRTGTTA